MSWLGGVADALFGISAGICKAYQATVDRPLCDLLCHTHAVGWRSSINHNAEVIAMKEKPNGHSNAHSQPLCVTLILDESGSMQSCKGAAIAGFNQYVATLRQDPADTRFTLILFNSGKIEARYQMTPMAAVRDLDVETYRPGDTTPLYDAIGRTLSAARREARPRRDTSA